MRRELELTTQKQHEFLPLERAREAAMRTLAAEQARLEGEVAQRERRLAEVRQACARLAALQVELRRVQQESAALGQVEAQHRELQAIVGRAREEAAEKRTVNTQLKKEMFTLREQLDQLEKLSTCRYRYGPTVNVSWLALAAWIARFRDVDSAQPPSTRSSLPAS